MPSVSVGPAIGGIANINALMGPASITVTVPPGAFTLPVDLQLAPFPPPPVQITDLITDGLSIIGLPFRIDPLVNGLPLPALTVSQPLTVTLDYSGLPPGGLVTDLGLLEVVQNPGIGGLGDLFRLLGPGCGPASQPRRIAVFSARVSDRRPAASCAAGDDGGREANPGGRAGV